MLMARGGAYREPVPQEVAPTRLYKAGAAPLPTQGARRRTLPGSAKALRTNHLLDLALASYNLTRFSRSALPMTLTEDRAMAAAAMIGESKIPKKG